MTLDHRRIETIVSEVLERLEAQRAGREAGARPGPASPLGVHPDLDSAIRAAQEAFAAYDQVPLSTRHAIVAAIRETLAANYRVLSEVAVEETGLGRVEDKILKNRLVTEKTPGPEDLEPLTWTGDHGLTLLERAPYGPIAVITPVTNPTETVINNGISMIAGGKAITAGPGNPPSVVDETADLERAARDLIAGASLDNNIICTDEKEVIAVALIADRLKECFARAGAVVLPPHQTERLRGLLLEKE